MYIGPMYGDIQKLTSKKAEYVTAISNINQLKVHRDEILAQYNAIAPSDIARLQKIIPDTSNSVDIVSNISSIAAQYGMSIRQVKINVSQVQPRNAATQTTPVDPYKQTSISFTITGPYEQFIAFLKFMESNIRLFDVTDLVIGANQKGPSAGVFDYTVSVTAYSLH